MINGDYMNKIYKNEINLTGVIISLAISPAIVAPNERNQIRQNALDKETRESDILKEKDKISKKLFPLSELLIRIRTKFWLIDNNINRFPLSYIFDKFSEEDKKNIMREKEICIEISKLTEELGKYPIPNLRLPDSVFKQSEDKMQDASYFLEKSGPSILQEIQRERRDRRYRSRSRSLRGGKKVKTVKACRT
jgi:hypothetical protein